MNLLLTTCKEAAELLNSGRALKAIFRPIDLPLASGEFPDTKEVIRMQLGLMPGENSNSVYSPDDPAYVWLEDNNE